MYVSWKIKGFFFELLCMKVGKAAGERWKSMSEDVSSAIFITMATCFWQHTSICTDFGYQLISPLFFACVLVHQYLVYWTFTICFNDFWILFLTIFWKSTCAYYHFRFPSKYLPWSSVSSANHRAMYISGHCTSKFSVFKEGLLLINVIISSNAFIACLWRKKLLTRPKLKNGKLSTKNKWRSTIRNRWKNCIFVSFETAICLTCCCLTLFYFTVHRKVLLKMAWRVMKRMRRWMA